MPRGLFLLALSITVAGCSPKAPGPEAASSGASAGAPSVAGEALTGPVLEQLPASPYTYLRIKTSRGEVWAAVPETTVEIGTVVTVAGPMLMTNFASSALNRTFEEVYFGTLGTDDAAAPAPGASPHGGGDPHAGVTRTAPVEVGTVEKAGGPDGRSIAELWARPASLEGRTVTVHGVVVKVNNGVMGKNWIHLQDGSGDAARGTNDITVTSMDQAVTGATITVRGTVRTNKDFGAGYVYPVIVEDAKIVK